MSGFAPVSSGAQVLPDEEVGSVEGLDTDHHVDTTVDDEQQEQKQVAEPKNDAGAGSEDELPEQFRGKSLKDVIAMYAEAQKVIGRQGQEVGELRRLADTAIRASLAAKQAPAEPKPAPKAIDEADIFARPKETIEQLISEHPAVKAAEKSAAELAAERAKNAKERAKQAFDSAHPDAAEVIADEGFRNWVGSSKVRQALFRRAHTAFDFDAGNELFATWKELQAAKKAAAAPIKEAKDTVRKEKLKAATVPSGAAPTGNAGSKKIFRRADILALMENDPERYEALSPEIQKAYEEGRVR